MSTLRTQQLQHPSAVSPALTMANDGSAAAQFSAINGGPLAGFRNAIINGSFDFWQRGTSVSAAAYGADRWLNLYGGSTAVTSRQAFTLGQTNVPGEPQFFSRTVVSSVANAGSYSFLAQRIEGVRTFAGQTVTISFWAKADTTRPIAIELLQSFGTGGSFSSGVTGIGATKFTLTSTWQLISLTVSVPSISGKLIGTAGDDYLALNIWFDGGSNFNSRTATLGQQSGTFDIARVQVEPGSFRTPFELRLPATEQALCKRYGQWVPFNMLFYAPVNNAVMESTMTWPEMRTKPTAATVVADPNTAQANINNVANTILRLTPYGGSSSLQANLAGTSYVVGYRSWLDAEL